jgi:hypothetical protein
MFVMVCSIRSKLASLFSGTVRYAVDANLVLNENGFNGLQGQVKLEADAGTVSGVTDDVRCSRSGVSPDEQCERVKDFEMTVPASLTPDTKPAQRSLTMTTWLLARNPDGTCYVSEMWSISLTMESASFPASAAERRSLGAAQSNAVMARRIDLRERAIAAFVFHGGCARFTGSAVQDRCEGGVHFVRVGRLSGLIPGIQAAPSAAAAVNVRGRAGDWRFG